MAEIRVGISGWRYAPWREVFYPQRLPQRQELTFAAECLNSIEINGSFYSLQRPSAYQQWYDETPPDFIFSVKGSRYITHMKRLKDLRQAQANFWASGILHLEEKLGPILWQLPPNLRFDREVTEEFLAALPKTTVEAATIARGRSSFLKDRSWYAVRKSRQIRHAMEVPNESFITSEFLQLLRRHRVALVIADTAKKWPYMEEITTDFIYARLHGERELYSGSYDDESLDRWARRLRKWRGGARGGRDTYVYFDNDVKVDAPFDAMRLARRLGIRRDYEHIKSGALRTGRRKSRQEKRNSPWPLTR